MKIGAILSFIAVLVLAGAVELELEDKDSVNNALSLIADGLMNYYQGTSEDGQTVGMFTKPYYWWEAGAAWGSMIDFWYYTGNDTYNDKVKKALLGETGKNNDYLPSSQTATEGNDDQGFWSITVMAAAERNFSNPKEDEPQWLALAQAVFNTMTTRWDTKKENCGGGLRWQIYPWNSGYDYKNTVSNGCMFNVAARLARYTGNKTYEEWAEKIYDWVEGVGWVTSDYKLYDGGYIKNECKVNDKVQWTYNYGLFISGAAAMYNHTEDSKWKDRAEGLWKASSEILFKDKVMYESGCQPSKRCTNDQRCFKAIYSRFLGLTMQLMPNLASEILSYLKPSAEAAAKSCSGGTDGHTCGLNWFEGYDEQFGMGEQMCALEAIQNTMAPSKKPPLTKESGGTSKGDPNAGSNSNSEAMTKNELDIATKDRAGAGVLTIVVVSIMCVTAFWMLK